MEAELFLKMQLELGEGPRWDGRSGRLYFVDILKGDFYLLDPHTKKLTRHNAGTSLGCLGLRRGPGLVMGTGRGFEAWEPGAGTHPIPGMAFGDPEIRFNDGAVDRAGRFWAGAKARRGHAHLYRLDPDWTIRTMDTGFAICNGLGWSLDNRVMYFTDSLDHTIYAYDFDLPTGGIANRRVWARVEPPATPDGLAVDSQGCVWSCLWDGGRVVRFDPQGRVMEEIRLPVPRPTACAFGGAELDVLYITSAWEGYTAEERRRYPLSGDLFVAQPGVKGLPEPLFGA